MLDNVDLALLASVREVVVAGAHVVVGAEPGDLLGAKVKVRAGVVKLRHLAAELDCQHKDEHKCEMQTSERRERERRDFFKHKLVFQMQTYSCGEERGRP